ncbi:6682_t:CDS:2 [Funneliformis geosporum]|nr:6682_t:CDS:2 [Funneliformis geosporum]
MALGKSKEIKSRDLLDSVLVKSLHFVLFANWINNKDGLNDKSRNVHYDFKLLYRASRDGMDATIFHKKCDDKGATIFVAKIKNTKHVIGGYNPLYWTSSGKGVYNTTSDSFIFSFSDYSNGNEGKLGRVMGGEEHYEQYAIASYNGHGPIFGGKDIVSPNNGKWTSIPRVYPNLNIPTSYEIDDYEVFQKLGKVEIEAG